MSWIVVESNHGIRIVWDDEDGTGMTLGEYRDTYDSLLLAIDSALEAVKTEKDDRGFYWPSSTAAQKALRLVKAAEKAWKAKQSLVCPCCKQIVPTKK